MLGLIYVEFAYGLSISILTFDLEWPWTFLNPSHKTSASDISNTRRDTMLDTVEIKLETMNGLSIGTMTFDIGWPWTVLVQGH